MNVRKVLLKGGAGIGGTALLAGAMWLHSFLPEVRATALEPIRNGGTIGEEVRNRDFSVRVEKVEAARSLAPNLSLGDPPPIGTEGIYLIVRVKATSHREPVDLRTADLETPGGYTFEKDPRGGSASARAQPTLQPMIWSAATFVFELPEKRLEGAHLVLGAGGLLPQLSAEADIDLGITGKRADELIKGAPDRYDIRADTP
ncbi:hypothetical protein [Actinomadura sp. 7K507]|uniref:hypothetical protein n=1 Tax=Actinomadura sp. 7K507 TaxID=2530365 RepID=UPI00104917FF|nr:hypothetical protein [Actinomadura sp. 7K507]TDC90337.1 hypothetical protein E1285_14915 [Actinomadura sp. 7K507]